MSGSNNYHYNMTTNRMNKCNAEERGCPLGTNIPHVQAENTADAKKLYEKNYKTEMVNTRYLGRKKTIPQINYSQNIKTSTEIDPNYLIPDYDKPYTFNYYKGETIHEIQENIIKDYKELKKKYPHHEKIRESKDAELRQKINQYFDSNYEKSGTNSLYKNGRVYKDAHGRYLREYNHEYVGYEILQPEAPFRNNYAQYKVEDVTSPYNDYEGAKSRLRVTYAYEIKDKDMFKETEEIKKLIALSYSIENMKNKNLPDWVSLPPVKEKSQHNDMENLNQDEKTIENLHEVSETFRTYKHLTEYSNLSEEEYYDKLFERDKFYMPFASDSPGIRDAETAGEIFKEAFIEKLSFYYPDKDKFVRRAYAEDFVRDNPGSPRENVKWLENNESFRNQASINATIIY